MKKRVSSLFFILLLIFGVNITTIYAESTIGESYKLKTTSPQTITLANSPTERPKIEQLKRIAKKKGITLEEALDAYVVEQVNSGLGGAYEGDTGKVSANNDLEDLPTLPPNIIIDGITLDELEDLKVIAQSEGISFDEAIDRFAWQTEFVRVADKLEETYPDTFAGAIFHSDGKGAWIAFKESIPKDAINLSSTLPATINLVGNQGFSELELKTELEAIHDNIYQRDEISNVNSYYDIQTGVITIESQPKESLSVLQRKNLLSTMEELQPQNKNIIVEYKLIDKLESGNESKYVRGGGFLNKSSGNCTAGFTLRNNSGGRGLATAHHCTGTFTYANHSGNRGTTTVKRVKSHAGKYGDLARYTVGTKTAARTFYYNWNKKRYATAVGSPRVGIRVCNFGRKSGNKCDEIYKLNTARGQYQGMVSTRKHYTTNGDSGGPWYYGGTAYGIHSGYSTISRGQRSQFSPARNLPSAVGMRVHTK